MEFKDKGFQIESRRLKGLPPPDWALDEPATPPYGEFFMTAFFHLDTCRQYGQTVGPIPWRDMLTYAQWAGLDPENTEAFIFIISKLDEIYLEHCAKKVKLAYGNIQHKNRR